MPKQEMQSSKLSGTKPAASTQQFLDIAEIKEGTVTLKDGSLRAVVAVSSTNFSLKSAEEQAAMINAYQGFLNGLGFPIQIVMQSRKLDIHAYLERMRSVMAEQTNELLRSQTAEYIDYVTKLVEFASIMNKTFYVVVPYFTGTAVKRGLFNRLGHLFNPVAGISAGNVEFENNREQLYQRVNQITGGLSGMGLRTIILSTEELIELYYNSYNLSSSQQLKIGHLEELDLASPQE